MRRAGTLLLTALCALAGAGRAQSIASEERRAPSIVHYGKWAALAIATGSTILGATTHERADRDFAALIAYCRDHGPCPIGADGRYGNPAAERLYGRVRDADLLARGWLLGGEVAFVGTVVLFVMDLGKTGAPENIPYSPYIVAGRFGTRVGVQVALGRR